MTGFEIAIPQEGTGGLGCRWTHALRYNNSPSSSVEADGVMDHKLRDIGVDEKGFRIRGLRGVVNVQYFNVFASVNEARVNLKDIPFLVCSLGTTQGRGQAKLVTDGLRLDGDGQTDLPEMIASLWAEANVSPHRNGRLINWAYLRYFLSVCSLLSLFL